MSDANERELQEGLATTDPRPPLVVRRAGPSTHPSVGCAVSVYYVAPTSCSDSSAGTEAQPFCTVLKGVQACRAASGSCAVFLRGGVHRLNETIVLGPSDSKLTIAGYSGEDAVVSGTTPLAVSAWQKVKDVGTTTIWKVPVTTRPAAIETLLVDGVRAIPARYPNANPELDRFPIGYIQSSTDWSVPAELGTPSFIEYNGTANFRPSYRSLFKDYRGGVGGQCSVYDPPFSYWCAQKPEGGGASEFVLPSGLSFTPSQLPSAPYKNVTGGRITAWRPGHWANWQFELNGTKAAKGRTELTFGKGGFQGGRGNARGAEWFISHLHEELDFPSEYWYDADDAMLYFVSGTGTLDCKGDPNCNATRTQAPPVGGSKPPAFEAAHLKTLFRLQGTQAAPVTQVTLSSLTFTGAAMTFLDPHGVPSGGDWALQRSAALFLEGTVNTTVEACSLVRLDGNAIMLSGFNRYANISHNTILSTGATAIALWGYSNGTHPLQPTGTGPDGTEGNFPRYTRVHGNFIRHLGIHEKQSSCLFQAKSAQTLVSNNICFDVPRAGFNLNDGFGGGNNISFNLLFQTCGESGDHGALNTWDRQSFITTVRDGTPSIVPAMTAIHHNFIVADYDADGGMVDNDDGSSFYDEYANFGVYGGAKMGNFDGHSKLSHGNVFAFPNVYGKSCFWNWDGWFPTEGHSERFVNNTCIMDGPGQKYISMPSSCTFDNSSTVHVIARDNKVFAPNADAVVNGCGSKLPFAEWMKLGVDQGSTLAALPSNDEVIAMGSAVLGVPLLV